MGLKSTIAAGLAAISIAFFAAPSADAGARVTVGVGNTGVNHCGQRRNGCGKTRRPVVNLGNGHRRNGHAHNSGVRIGVGIGLGTPNRGVVRFGSPRNRVVVRGYGYRPYRRGTVVVGGPVYRVAPRDRVVVYANGKKGGNVSCAYAKESVYDSGFDDVKVNECKGSVYTFTAWRGDTLYRVKVNARNGNVIAANDI